MKGVAGVEVGDVTARRLAALCAASSAATCPPRRASESEIPRLSIRDEEWGVS